MKDTKIYLNVAKGTGTRGARPYSIGQNSFELRSLPVHTGCNPEATLLLLPPSLFRPGRFAAIFMANKTAPRGRFALRSVRSAQAGRVSVKLERVISLSYNLARFG